MSEDKNDHQYGPEKALEAIDALNGRDMGDGKLLYVKPALAASQRKTELIRETIKYKNSKKRCNLYVKNFPASWDTKNLENLFGAYGKIENIKLETGFQSNTFAFVCFRRRCHVRFVMRTKEMPGGPHPIFVYQLAVRRPPVEPTPLGSNTRAFMTARAGPRAKAPWVAQLLLPHVALVRHDKHLQIGRSINFRDATRCVIAPK